LPFLLPDTPIASLDEYVEHWSGGQGIARADELGPDGVIDELERSGLRGRGGAGFPTGRKWRSVHAGGSSSSSGEEVGDRWVVANGAEGEPGTFKDRALMARNPYQVIEGIEIAARTIGAVGGYVAVKASFEQQIEALTRALEEMAGAGMVGTAPLTLVTGPDEYLFGEEKGLLEVIEGEDPLPRLFPPYLYGLFTASPQVGWSAHEDRSTDGVEVPSANPTLVNNAETLANVVPILVRGADWHTSLGTTRSPGVVICTVVGDTRRAGVAEVELGTPLGDVLVQLGGGMPTGRRVQAVLSGVANGVLTADAVDTPMTYEDLEAAGGGLGAAGFIVYDDTADMIAVAHAISRFLYVESCGQCPPCKIGTGAITDRLECVLAGDATMHDIEVLTASLGTVADANRCYLPVQEQLVVRSILDRFSDQLESHLEGRAAAPREIVVPKLLDIVDGVAVIDERQALKRPDWTYAA
jgi:NADH:ubiquinone oxidoreductase subunit F (NADH-binding)